jgi:hypothetical protein
LRRTLPVRIAVIASSLLCGCKEETLKGCLLQGEQITATRRLESVQQVKQSLENCERLFGSRSMCEATFLDTNNVVRVCMEAEYFVFFDDERDAPRCSYDQFQDPACY